MRSGIISFRSRQVVPDGYRKRPATTARYERKMAVSLDAKRQVTRKRMVKADARQNHDGSTSNLAESFQINGRP